MTPHLQFVQAQAGVRVLLGGSKKLIVAIEITLYFLLGRGLEINMGRKKRNSIADSNPRGAGFYALLGPPHGRDVSFLPDLLAGGVWRCRCENGVHSPLARFCV